MSTQAQDPVTRKYIDTDIYEYRFGEHIAYGNAEGQIDHAPTQADADAVAAALEALTYEEWQAIARSE